MSRTSLDFGSSPHVNSAPWLFSDPYAYQYADIPEHIRTISTSAARQPPRNGKEGQATPNTGVVVGAVEAGSVPVFEMEGCMPPVPTVTITEGTVEMAGSSPGMRFELEGCSGGRGGPAKLTITPPSGPTTGSSPGTPGGAAASPLMPGCLQVGGGDLKSPRGPDRNGEGMELFIAPTKGYTPPTPTSPGAGLLRRTTAHRSVSRPCKSGVPAVQIAEVRRGTPPPPYAMAPPSNTPTVAPPNIQLQQMYQRQVPLSPLPPHLRQPQQKRQSHTAPSSPVTPSRTTSPAPPASDLDSILRNIDSDRRLNRLAAADTEWESRRLSRGSRAYEKYCDNN
ncbi:hypothetical protein PG993_011508 [Apiospora rasikravindrae]|uniref:Uncharacterized protein n=1 Tax=Apiospora rasikravindrae TaxID=990691 RepID=A0ABR1SEE8_9PEZI